MLSVWDYVRAMIGPCWDHDWPSFTYRPARALKFSRLDYHGLKPMSIGSCQGDVWAMMGPAKPDFCPFPSHTPQPPG